MLGGVLAHDAARVAPPDLLIARHQLLLVNRGFVTDLPELIPAELDSIFWEFETDPVLAAVEAALAEAADADAGLTGPKRLALPELGAMRPRLVVDNDNARRSALRRGRVRQSPTLAFP